MNYTADLYLNAWKAEWNNITSLIQKTYKYEADKKIIDDYKKSFEVFVEKAYDMESLNWADTTEEPGENRTSGTGAPSAALGEQAELYKMQVLRLINKYGDQFNGGYKFIYKGNGAEIEKLRKETN